MGLPSHACVEGRKSDVSETLDASDDVADHKLYKGANDPPLPYMRAIEIH